MSIRKALITCAGFGTRFLPVTKAVQKEMLPIWNRPVIDYTVSACIAAGVEEIVFIVRSGDTQVREFYSESKKLYAFLEKAGKLALYPEIERLHTQAKYTFLEQPGDAVYGTGTPVKLAKEFLEREEAFLVLMGDDFVYQSGGATHIRQMVELYEQVKPAAVMSCIRRPAQELHRYGIAETYQQDGKLYARTIIEKPAPGAAPSDLANISKYVFTPAVFPLLEAQAVNPVHKELQITDTVTELAKNQPVAVCVPEGEYLDCGTPEGWLNANQTVARDLHQITR